MSVEGHVPTRFLVLTAHLVITIVIMSDRRENVLSCLPLKFSPEAFDDRDAELIAALSLSLIGMALEFFSFLGGLSTFRPGIATVSIAAHCSGSVASAFFIWDVWPCHFYWLLVLFCSALPALFEIFLIVGIFACKKPL